MIIKQLKTQNSKVKTNDGFTLLELLLVMFIIGLSAALSIPVVGSSIDSLKIKSAAKNLSTILKHARNTAIAEKQPYTVQIKPQENMVFLAPFLKPESKKEIKLSEKAKIAKVTRFNAPAELEEKTITFYPRGNSSGGSITIHDANDRPAYIINIEPATARVKVERM